MAFLTLLSNGSAGALYLNCIDKYDTMLQYFQGDQMLFSTDGNYQL
jgi:hypothetical protein